MSAKILIVEDDPNNLRLLELLLAHAGHNTHSASNGLECLQRVKEERPDLILMDVELPKLDGYETTRILRQDSSTAAIPIIGVSSFASAESHQAALDSGMNDYIEKPISVSNFVKQISPYLPATEKLS